MTPTTTTTAPPAARVPLAARVAETQNWPTPADPDSTARVAGELLADVLAELAELGVRVPAGVTRALALDRETAAVLVRPPAIGEWLAGQDLDTVTGEAIAARMRDQVVSLEVGNHGGPLAREVSNHLTEAAIDALADDLDDVIDQLRPSWDAAAAVVAAAVRAGITAATPAEQAINDDDQVEAWRALAPAVATLDRLDRVNHRALYVGGYPLGLHEQARRGRAAWLDASAAGPVVLLAPSARPEPALDERPRVGAHRSAMGVQMQGEHTAALQQAARVREDERMTMVRRMAEQRAAADLDEDDGAEDADRVVVAGRIDTVGAA